jgi:hypothetical protein
VPPDPEYRVWYSASATEFLFALSSREQWRLWRQVDELARNPFLRRGYRLTDNEGHELEHHVTDAWIITYWIDHPHCAVMLVEVEKKS